MRALVLCGGLGTRLGNAGSGLPKPLVVANGRSLLEWIVAHLTRSGVRELLVNSHHRAALVEEAARALASPTLEVHCAREATLLGTAGTVRHHGEWLAAKGDFVVHYGDVVHDGDLEGLIARHRSSSAAVTLAVHVNRDSNSLVRRHATGRVVEFLERPTPEERRAAMGVADEAWAFSGVCIVSSAALELWPEHAVDLPRDVFAPLVRRGARVEAWPLGGTRVAVDSPERLERLRVLLAGGACRPGGVRAPHA